MNKTLGIDDGLHAYLLSINPVEHPVLTALREATAKDNPYAVMQIAPEQGHLMAWLIKLLRVNHYLEIGVFTGYSALTAALAMGPTGRIVACDQSIDFTNMAQQYWLAAGVSEQIDLRLGMAADTLEDMQNTHALTFDMIFIDADKPSYPRYLDLTYPLLRTGGVLLVDNVFLSGKVMNPRFGKRTGDVVLHEFNRDLVHDSRFDHCVLPIGDGLSLLIKR
jgi:predicted O-methyltransferase YrrM